MLPSSVFEQIFNTSPVGEYLLTPNAEILAVNDTFLKVAGRKREDLVGKNLFDVFPSNPDDPEDTGLDALQKSLARVAETGRPDTLALQRYPIWVELSDGSRRYEERFWSAVNTPIFDDKGELRYIAHSTMDVTDMAVAQGERDRQPVATESGHLEAGLFTRAQMLQEVNKALKAERSRLMDSVSRWRSLFEQAPGFACLLAGKDHIFVFANPQYLKLIGKVEVIGKSVIEALPWAEKQGFLGVLDEVYRTGTPYEAHAARITVPAQETTRESHRYLDFVYQPIRNEAGEVDGIFVLGSDVTEQKEAESALREADRRKDVFLATLAHELRNPLAPIRTGIDVLRLTGSNPETMERSLSMMDRQTEHLVRLVDDLLDISRISQGKLTLRLEETDLREAVHRALEVCNSQINAGQRRVSVDLPPAPVTVAGDATRLVQIISNLLNNAAKHTEENGRIEVNMCVVDGWAELSIRDDGAGIAPEMQTQLFEMFMQVDPNRGGGLGIGLTLVRSLVELQGGTVQVASDGLGHGSEFTVKLPLSSAHPTADKSAMDSETASLDGRRILVVDDNEDAAASLAMLLQVLGAEVSAVNDGESALSVLEEFRPDMVFLDLGMPHMDGFEVARAMRAHACGAEIILIALTGWGQDADRRRTKKAGFDHHLVKPVGVKDITQVALGNAK